MREPGPPVQKHNHAEASYADASVRSYSGRQGRSEGRPPERLMLLRRTPGHSEAAGPCDGRPRLGARSPFRDTSGKREFARRRRIPADVQTSILRLFRKVPPIWQPRAEPLNQRDSPVWTVSSRARARRYIRSSGTMPRVSRPSRNTRPTRRHRRSRARRVRSSGACSTGHAAKNELNDVARSNR